MTQPYTYGQSALHQGDCLTWLKKRAKTHGRSIHAVVTDPPYGINEYLELEKQKLRQGRGGVWRIAPSFDGHQRSPLPRFTVLSPSDLDYLHDFFKAWAELLRPTLFPGANIMVACNPLISPYISMALTRAGLERRGEIVRLVMTMRGGDRPKNAHQEFSDVTVMPRSKWEPWLLYREPVEAKSTVADNLRKYRTGGLRRISDDQPFYDVIPSGPTGKAERTLVKHPSLKPQAFLRQVVRAALPLGEGVILDPFAGSGSTLAAAEAVGYESIGIELDPEYLAVAQEAIPKLAALDVRAPVVEDEPTLFDDELGVIDLRLASGAELCACEQ